jgi:hypothetical protein
VLEQFGQVQEDKEETFDSICQFPKGEMSCSLRFLTVKIGHGTFVKSMSSLVYAFATFWNLESFSLQVANSGDTDSYISDIFRTLTNVVLPPRFHTLDCKFERMVYNHKSLDWVSLFFLLMAKNRNRSLQTLKLDLLFFANDEYSQRYMDSLQEMVTHNKSLRRI